VHDTSVPNLVIGKIQALKIVQMLCLTENLDASNCNRIGRDIQVSAILQDLCSGNIVKLFILNKVHAQGQRVDVLKEELFILGVIQFFVRLKNEVQLRTTDLSSDQTESIRVVIQPEF